MAVFTIGSTDFSGHTIAGTYSVSKRPVYASWTDGNGSKHQRLKRYKMQGSFSMFFRTMEEYQAFITAIEDSKTENANSYVTATLKDNISNEDCTGYYYLDFSPVRNRDAGWADYIEAFTVNVEEY